MEVLQSTREREMDEREQREEEELMAQEAQGHDKTASEGGGLI
jgi:hypothetical protein